MEKIELNNKKRLMKYNKLSKEEIRHYLDDASVKVNRLIEKVGNDGFLHTNSRNGLYPKALNDQWTNGFWTGIIWQMYLYTKNEKYFNIGKIHTKLFDQRASKGHDGLTNHDVGFLYSLSAVADYKITGDKYALDVALKATKVLAERFLPNVGVIQAWGKIGEDGVNLDTVNLSLDFDVWYAPGTDVSIATPELKSFIKENVESINENGMNNLFISNLMRKIENTYAYVDHIRFNHINAFDTEFQAVINYKEDINDLSVEERRNFVPEFLVADTNDIHITEYFAGQKTV